MIKNIMRHLCVAALLAMPLVAHSKISIFKSKTPDTLLSVYDHLIDSLLSVDIIPRGERVVAEYTLPELTPLVEPHYEEFNFDALQSSKVLLAEYSKVLEEDIFISHDELKRTFHFPLDTGYVTSRYGWRKRRMHAGVDIKAHKGDNIYAMFDGVVRMSKYYTAFGNVVVIRHHNGLESLYAHASQLKVKVNDRVKSGDVIALAGRTGRATGDHLHLELRVQGQCFDPEVLLDVKNLTHRDEKNLYITMQNGRIFASTNDSEEARKAEIKEALRVKYHSVRSGDTLSRIAVNNNTTITALCRLNNIKSTSTLRIGQRIRVR